MLRLAHVDACFAICVRQAVEVLQVVVEAQSGLSARVAVFIEAELGLALSLRSEDVSNICGGSSKIKIILLPSAIGFSDVSHCDGVFVALPAVVA